MQRFADPKSESGCKTFVEVIGTVMDKKTIAFLMYIDMGSSIGT